MKTVSLNLAIALVYFVLGILSLQLIVPFSKVGSIWPPAGISLAAALLYGKRILPGVFVGNALVNTFTFGFSWEGLLIYSMIATGAPAGAFLGSFLIKRFVGFPNNWIRDRDIIRSLLVCAPVGCMVSATIGVSVITLNGLILPSEASINWACWWVGDVIGVMTFTPITLALQVKNNPVWRSRRYSLVIPMVIAFTFVVLFFSFVLHQEKKMQQQHFASTALLFARTLEKQIEPQVQFAKTMSDFYESRPKNDELNKYIQNYTSKFSSFESIKWIKHPAADAPQSEYAPWLKKIQKLPGNSSTNDYTIYSFIDRNSIVLSVPISRDNKMLDGLVNYRLSLTQLIQDTFDQLPDTPITLTITQASTGKTLFSNLEDVDYTLSKTIPFSAAHLIADNWMFHFYKKPSLARGAVHWAIWWVLTGGVLFTCLLSLGILMITGRYTRIETIVKERTAELLRAKEVAENASNAKNLFLSNVSHELRTPLNGLLGFSELLEKDPNTSEDQQNKLKIITHCGKQLLLLIDDLLDFSRIETGKLKIEYKAFDLNQMLRSIQDIYKLRYNQKNLFFKLNVCDLDQPVYSDEKHIRQIIINLIDNAFKFTNSGGVILTSTCSKNRLRLTVADTGCGIPNEKQRYIFDPFTQVSVDKEFSHQGIGLGLAITSKLVQLLGGKITLNSKPQKGSEFSIEIPLSFQANNKQALVNTLDPKIYQPAKVLLAEDDETNQLLILNLLEQMNCTVQLAKNGQEALSYLKTGHYQLALIDLNMPVMNGISLIKAIRANETLDRKIKAVAISAYADGIKIKDAFSAGFDDYLAKPFTEQDLQNVIQDLA